MGVCWRVLILRKGWGWLMVASHYEQKSKLAHTAHLYLTPMIGFFLTSITSDLLMNNLNRLLNSIMRNFFFLKYFWFLQYLLLNLIFNLLDQSGHHFLNFLLNRLIEIYLCRSEFDFWLFAHGEINILNFFEELNRFAFLNHNLLSLIIEILWNFLDENFDGLDSGL